MKPLKLLKHSTETTLSLDINDGKVHDKDIDLILIANSNHCNNLILKKMYILIFPQTEL